MVITARRESFSRPPRMDYLAIDAPDTEAAPLSLQRIVSVPLAYGALASSFIVCTHDSSSPSSPGICPCSTVRLAELIDTLIHDVLAVEETRR